MEDIALSCPDCGQPLVRREGGLVCAGGHAFAIRGAVHSLLPHAVSETLAGDASYHAGLMEQWIELAQMNTLRNLHFHRRAVEFIASRTDAQSRILELGGGVGFDLRLFLETGAPFGRYVFSEISEAQAAYVARGVSDPRVTYFTADASRLPFGDHQFDFIYMVGALHHLPEPDNAVAEMKRATRPGGFLIYAIEPNRRLFLMLKTIVRRVRRLLPAKAHSPADEEAEGFLVRDFERIAAANGLRVVRLEPVWLISGVMHYGLEFLYRVLRLRRRIRLPKAAESAIIALDRVVLRVPGMRHLSWHYTVIYQRDFEADAPTRPVTLPARTPGIVGSMG